ncbi:hypothetical protein K490DRAFT_61879 [Saccharata proteae CBS 121410]|uniref:Uncharacterized protein n=1 Tax=Saccharata proteae CBS 121410 TaxID=1314787 RepID=A0A9P4I100_9PEZI|nr:hypothetical protein K490DRAFT_61879 [Saccharata proteae CBS 121410]
MPDSLSDSAWQVEPEDWERHVFVHCTAFQSVRLLDRFFAIADHGSASCRGIRLCLVLTSQHRRYNPTTAADRCPGLRKRGIRFVYEDARPAVPGVLDNVSIELDDHTAADGRTCLLRKNSGTHERYFGEVLDDFLDEVNFPNNEISHRIRVKLIDTTSDHSEYSLVTNSPVPQLSHPFINLSVPALSRFVQHKCAHTHLSTKTFIILDALTPTTSTLLICTPNHDNTSLPLLVRSTFSACASIIGDIALNDSLADFANEAATSRGGYISTPLDHLPSLTSTSLAIPGLDEPIRSRILTPALSHYFTQTTPPLQQCITKIKTFGGKSKDCTPEPDFEYFKLTQRLAIGAATQVPMRDWKPPKRFGSRDSGLGESVRTVRYFDVGVGNQRADGNGDEIEEEEVGWEASPTARFGLKGEVEGTDVRTKGGREQDGCDQDDCEETEDGWFDLMLPDVSGFTQMGCD